MLELLVKARREAFTEIMQLRSRFHLSMSDEEKQAKRKQIELLDALETTNHELSEALIREKALGLENLNRVKSELTQRVDELTRTSDVLKKREVSGRVSNEVRNALVVQQKEALKRQLAKLDSEYNALKAELDKELKQKEAKQHELQQKLKNDRNLESAKKSNVEKLVIYCYSK